MEIKLKLTGKLVKMGNSYGLRIPIAFIHQKLLDSDKLYEYEIIRKVEKFQYNKRRSPLFRVPIHILALKMVRRANTRAKIKPPQGA